MFSANARVAVIDDEPDGRETVVDMLEENNFEGVPIVGQYGSDIDRLVREIEEADASFVICDHRLTAKQFARFSGLQVVERLIAIKRPAMLVTTYQETERLALRAARARVPVIKARDDFVYSEVGNLREVVRKEIENDPVVGRKRHRVLLRVEAVRPGDIDVVVPSWNGDHAFILPKTMIDVSIRGRLSEGDYLLGDVNIGAIDEEELFFDNIDEIVEGGDDLL